jgi:hypothetical protein
MRFWLAFAVVFALSSTAYARTSADYVYTYDQLWRASVRLIAVDFRFSITERYPEIGFLLFEYREGSRTFPGSVELVRTGTEGAEGVRVVVTIEAMPSYVERVVLDRLGRKLYEEYGTPPRRPRPVQPPAPPPEEDAPETDEEEQAPREPS